MFLNYALQQAIATQMAPDLLLKFAKEQLAFEVHKGNRAPHLLGILDAIADFQLAELKQPALQRRMPELPRDRN